MIILEITLLILITILISLIVLLLKNQIAIKCFIQLLMDSDIKLMDTLNKYTGTNQLLLDTIAEKLDDSGKNNRSN